MEVIQKQGKAALPLPTEILLAQSRASWGPAQYWWLLIAGSNRDRRGLRACALDQGGPALDTTAMKLRIPVLGNLIKKAAISRFAITFATLL
jgi:type II secretory pathway component PulF